MAHRARGAYGASCEAVTSDLSGQLVSRVNARAYQSLRGEQPGAPPRKDQVTPQREGCRGASPRAPVVQVAWPFTPTTRCPLPRAGYF